MIKLIQPNIIWQFEQFGDKKFLKDSIKVSGASFNCCVETKDDEVEWEMDIGVKDVMINDFNQNTITTSAIEIMSYFIINANSQSDSKMAPWFNINSMIFKCLSKATDWSSNRCLLLLLTISSVFGSVLTKSDFLNVIITELVKIELRNGAETDNLFNLFLVQITFYLYHSPK